MTVRLTKRVLGRWQKIMADPDHGDDTNIELLLTSQHAPPEASRVLSACLNRATGRFFGAGLEPGPSGEAPFPGEWSVVPVSDGALLYGGRKCETVEHGEFLITAVVAALDRQGVRGKLDLFLQPRPPRPPEAGDCLQASVQVLGRYLDDGHQHHWFAQRSAFEHVAAAATHWCLGSRPDVGITLQAGATPIMLVRRHEVPSQRVREVLYSEWRIYFHSIGTDRFRGLVTSHSDGRVTLIAGGAATGAVSWQATVASMQSFLSEQADRLVYGWVSRMGSISEATYLGSLPDTFSKGRRWADSGSALAHRLAPDACAIQLLGPTYAPRIPRHSDWHATSLDAGRTLLTHTESEAWLQPPTISERLRDRDCRAEIAAHARETLAPILNDFAPDDQARRRLHERREAHNPTLRKALRAKILALPPPSHIDLWEVAFVLDDGTIIENVEVTRSGDIVARIDDDPVITLDLQTVVDVRDRSPRAPD
jgi:hypothetical protein